MSSTAARHAPTDLRLVSCDEVSGIVAYAAPSAHDAGRTNVVSLDTETNDVICDCAAAEFGKVCWHCREVAAAWSASPAIQAVRWLTADALRRYGTKHAMLVRTYTARIGRPLDDDVVALVAARAEWRRRVAARRERAEGRDAEAVALAA